jgi:hypothetical protein
MILKTVTLAAVLIAGATSLAMAQAGPVTGTGPGAKPPSSYKGPGGMPSYNSSQFQRGPALYNQAPGAGMPPKGYKGPGGMPSYAESQQPAAIDNKASSGGNDSNGMPPASYKGPGGMPSYKTPR